MIEEGWVLQILEASSNGHCTKDISSRIANGKQPFIKKQMGLGAEKETIEVLEIERCESPKRTI